MLSRDGISGLVCLTISLGLLVLTWGLPPAAMVPIGPAFYPRIVLSFMALLSIILLGLDLRTVSERRAAASAAAAPAPSQPAPNYRLVLETFIAFGLYIALLPALGFRISTFLFVAALQITLEWPRSPKRWALVPVIALATTIVCYFAFENYLSVLLPRGHWSGM